MGKGPKAKKIVKLVNAMRSQPGMYFSPQISLHVRCVELHTYTPGDGLMIEGHRDQGSIVTMTVLLSDAHSFEGGIFITCARGEPCDGDSTLGGTHVPHLASRGDAFLFHSEKMHNVSPVVRGVRHTLVIELWLSEPNKMDRHS